MRLATTEEQPVGPDDIAHVRDVAARLEVADPQDRRRTSVSLTRAGQSLVSTLLENATRAHHRTLDPLTPEEQATFLMLLSRLM